MIDFFERVGLINVILPVVAAILGGIGTRIVDNRTFKANASSAEANAKALEIDNIKKQMDTYTSFIDDVQNRVKTVLIESRAREEDSLVREVDCAKRISKLEIQVAQLMVRACANDNCNERIFLEGVEGVKRS